MIKSSKLNQNVDQLNIAGPQATQHAAAMQKRMLELLNRSQVDPMTYVGLEYCGPQYCGRTGCSEACWFGGLRRRAVVNQELGQLLRKRQGKLCKVTILRPSWDRRYGELHEINIKSAQSVVARVLDGYNDRKMLAAGTLKVRPFGYNNRGTWRCSLNIIVAGEDDKIELNGRFYPKRPQYVHEIKVSHIKQLDATINDVMSCNEPAEPADRNYDGQREEFYEWLANMKVGLRLIRYGCDEAFKALA
jgi:hypothetical protein